MPNNPRSKMNKIKTAASFFLIIAASLSTNCQMAAAEDTDKDKEAKDPDYIMDTSNIGESDNGTIRSEQLLELGSLTPGALSLEGEQSLRQGSIDRALTVLQRSVELAPMDIDARILYAQTLEKKLMMEKKKKDPALFNFLIKQWFFVYQKADYLDEKLQGLSHVVELTGTQPKRFERPAKFLARVLIPEDGSVKVVIGGNNPAATKKLAEKAALNPDKDFSKKDSVF
jgi:hypothetical protein